MIEIYNTERTESFGCFVNFKVAIGMLSKLLNAGELGENPAVQVCSYKNNIPECEYVAEYSDGKWHESFHSQKNNIQ